MTGKRIKEMKSSPKIMIPDGAKRIIDILEGNGFEAYVVGGCVRDSLSLREPDDWDICTSATPEDVMMAVKRQEGKDTIKVIPTGIKHGTVTIVLKNDEVYEVTTFRVDGEYKDHRRPDRVSFVKSLHEDLSRRDFTVNAMAYSRERGLTDPFDGKKDLEDGIIRCVGDPEKRFEEDALRILRCVRFAAQLGFDIEERTAAAMTVKLWLLDDIAQERIRIEFEKLLCGMDALKVLRDHREVIAAFIPEIRPMFDLDQENPFHLYDVWMHTLHAVDSIPADKTMRLAAFFHDIGKPSCKIVNDGWGHFYGHEKCGAAITDAVMRRMKYDNETRKTVVTLIETHGIVFDPRGKQAGRLLYRLGEEDLSRLIMLERADVSAQHPDHVEERLENISAFEEKVREKIAENSVFKMNDLAIDGNDLIRMGIKQGKEIGRIKKELLESVVDGDLKNDREVLLARAKRLKNNL